MQCCRGEGGARVHQRGRQRHHRRLHTHPDTHTWAGECCRRQTASCSTWSSSRRHRGGGVVAVVGGEVEARGRPHRAKRLRRRRRCHCRHASEYWHATTTTAAAAAATACAQRGRRWHGCSVRCCVCVGATSGHGSAGGVVRSTRTPTNPRGGCRRLGRFHLRCVPQREATLRRRTRTRIRVRMRSTLPTSSRQPRRRLRRSHHG